jgi:hypothetical protein
MVIRVDRRFARERRASKLAAAIRDHLVHVHVELRAAARHPDVQGKHVVVLAGEDFVADLRDQPVGFVSQPLAGVVGNGSRLFEDGISRNHLTRDQILADAEMLERALRLRSPELVRRDIYFAKAVSFDAIFGHSIGFGIRRCRSKEERCQCRDDRAAIR